MPLNPIKKGYLLNSVLKWKKVSAKYQEVTAKIEQSDLTEAEKAELSARIFLMFNGEQLQAGQYFVYAGSAKTEATEFIQINSALFENRQNEITYVPNGGYAFTINDPVDYEQSTYERIEKTFGPGITKMLKESKGSWDGVVFGQGFIMPANKEEFKIIPVDINSPVKDGYIKIGTIKVNPVDETSASLPQDELNKLVSETGKGFITQMWDGVKQGAGKAAKVWNHPRTQGTMEVLGGAGEMAVGAAVAVGASSSVVGAVLGGAIVAHGADTCSTGFVKAVGGKEEKSSTIKGLELIGVPQQYVEPVNMVLGATEVLSAGRAIFKEGVKATAKVAGKKSKGIVSKVSVGETCPMDQLDGFIIGDHSPIVSGGGLKGHETLKRHTIDRHVGKSVESLQERLKKYPDTPAASSFYDRAIAEKVISNALDKRKLQIDAWLKNPQKPFHEIDGNWQVPVRNYVVRGSNIVEDLSTFRVVLEIDKKSPIGYGIKTAYPSKP